MMEVTSMNEYKIIPTQSYLALWKFETASDSRLNPHSTGREKFDPDCGGTDVMRRKAIRF
jgi:hypothetical protein